MQLGSQSEQHVVFGVKLGKDEFRIEGKFIAIPEWELLEITIFRGNEKVWFAQPHHVEPKKWHGFAKKERQELDLRIWNRYKTELVKMMLPWELPPEMVNGLSN